MWRKWDRGGSPGGVGSVDAGHKLAVGGAGGGEVVVAFGELQAQVDDLLLEPGDLLVEGVDVGGGAEPGGVPGALAEGVGEPTFEVLDAAVQPAARSWAASRSACSEARVTIGPERSRVAVGGSAASAWIFASRSRWR